MKTGYDNEAQFIRLNSRLERATGEEAERSFVFLLGRVIEVTRAFSIVTSSERKSWIS
jgi:hypothetical protein